jgi:hypothetical protein
MKMRALTLSEPWAWAIVDLAAEGVAKAKNVENRSTGFSSYTGPLAIHSGIGDQYTRYWETFRRQIERRTGRMAPDFEAIRGRGIIGRCECVANVVSTRNLLQDLHDQIADACDEHGLDFSVASMWIDGPRCLLLKNVVRLDHPIRIAGKQGLWSVPDELVLDVKGS